MSSDFDAFAKEWDAFRRTPSSVLSLFLPFLSGRVLDAGCGNGRNALAVAGLAESVVALDASGEMLFLAEKNLFGIPNASTRLGRLEQLPFESSSFDSVICLAALHHVRPSEHGRVFSEFFRVLSPGGFLCVAVWNRLQERFRLKPKELDVPWRGHSRYYYFFEEAELRGLAEAAGFSVAEVFCETSGEKVRAFKGQNLGLVAKR
ncbi:class I SAM-dependent methyltransferase [Candidatus Micrarchaeota archaeon]|nr:class I SAM-dependent methyltransferase [Candidatus Micrarchaeota archaeon]